MKKSYLVGCILIVIALLATVIGYKNNSDVISKDKALETVYEYVKENGLTVPENKTISRIAITEDLYSILTKSQEWIVLVNDREVTWIFIDSYNGRIKSTEKHELDSFYILPTEVSKFQKHFSWFLVFNYFIVILCIFNFNSKKYCKIIFYISLTHLVASVLFFEVVSFIYMWISILYIAVVNSIFDNVS